MWRKACLSVVASAAFAVAAFASAAQASTINISNIPLGGTPFYFGSALESSSAFNFGGGRYFLSNPVSYGGGNSGATSLAKPWSDTTTVFTESFMSFTANGNSANAFTLDFSGLRSEAYVIPEPALAILGLGDWTPTETPRDPTPIPAALSLFATGLGLIGLLVWLRSRAALWVPGRGMAGSHLMETEATIQTDFFHRILPPAALILGLVLTIVWISFLGYQIGRLIEATL